MYRHYSLNSKFLELQESLCNLIHNTLDTAPSLPNKVLNRNIWLDTHSYSATRGNKVYKPVITMFSKITVIFLVYLLTVLVSSHGPPLERDNEDITMGRKMGAKWCSMAKVCNHDRVPICGISHAGDIVGFRDLCDMFDYNCIRRRNYKQTACPEDKSILTVSRRPTNSFYDD